MPFKRGQVVLVLFPNSRNVVRHSSCRLTIPARTGLAQTIIAMITSNMARANHSSRVSILLATPEGQASGLLTDSVVMTDNMATVFNAERLTAHSARYPL